MKLVRCNSSLQRTLSSSQCSKSHHLDPRLICYYQYPRLILLLCVQLVVSVIRVSGTTATMFYLEYDTQDNSTQVCRSQQVHSSILSSSRLTHVKYMYTYYVLNRFYSNETTTGLYVSSVNRGLY